jgi:hypothetical protein
MPTCSEDTTMEDPENRFPDSTVTLSMLISESVYQLIKRIDRSIRWTERSTRPHRFLLRILLG